MQNNIVDSYMDYIQSELNFSLNEEFLQEIALIDKDKLVNSYKKNMKAVKMVLKDHGVDLNYIESQGKKAASIVKNAHKRNIPPKDVSKTVINKVFKPSIKKFVKGSITTADDDLEIPAEEKVFRSLMIFFIVGIVNTFLMLLCVPLFGPEVAMVILAIVIAPFVEEYAKRMAIFGKYPFIFTGIFAGLEALQYIIMLLAAGKTLIFAVMIRVLGVMLHFSTTLVQKWFYDRYEGDKEKSLVGYYVAVGIHSLFNTLAVMSAI